MSKQQQNFLLKTRPHVQIPKKYFSESLKEELFKKAYAEVERGNTVTIIYPNGDRVSLLPHRTTHLMDKISLPIEDIAELAHEINRSYCLAFGDTSQAPWDEAPQWQKESAIHGVELHLNGDHGPEASHQAWMDHKLRDGWTYGPEKSEEHRTHPCLVPFEELPVQQQAKDFIFATAVKTAAQLLVKQPNPNQKDISGYRKLDQAEVNWINCIKAKANELEELTEALDKTPLADVDKRWLAIGKTHLQQGIMALVRSVAKPTGF